MKTGSLAPWLLLLLAAIMEAIWLLCLKYLDMKAILRIPWNRFFENSGPFRTLLPLIAYIIFGLANVIFFSVAIKSIPMATAFAVWMGTALIGSLLIDIYYFKEPYNFLQMIFLMMIIVGIMGLKLSKT